MNKHQQKAFDKICDFLENEKDELAFGLFGYAGVGKSYLTTNLTRWCNEKGYNVLGVSPTHKARKVLQKFMELGTPKLFIKEPIQTMTVAALLLKHRKHSYVGSKNYKRSKEERSLKDVDFIFLDECSMVSDYDIRGVEDICAKNRVKVLYIGDPFQIPNPSQKMIMNEDMKMYSRKISSSFDANHVFLSEIVRQKKDNEIIQASMNLRNMKSLKHENGKDIIYFNNSHKFFDYIEDNVDLKNYKNMKIAVYTNASVHVYNRFIRDILKFDDKFVVGDILMGYSNLGYPNFIVENGEEYDVVCCSLETRYVVSKYTLKGWYVTMKDRTFESKRSVFFPLLDSEQNMDILFDLEKLATKVNSRRSCKKDYKEYKTLKDQVLFLENVYKYGDEIISESNMRIKHPLLFQSVKKYIRKGKIVQQFPQYSNILNDRLMDNKEIGEMEKFVDRFMIFEKDMDYGYAATTHKLQGSTYENVFVVSKDFDKLKSRWCNRLNGYIDNNKERNQLKYVAFTRASTKLFILHS